jgi:hypothetical protein
VWQPVRTDTRPPEICTNPAQCGLVLDAVRRRIAAREAKDFALADALRAELMATGIELEDLRDEQTTMWRQLGPDADRPTKDESVRRRSLHHIVRDALADAEPTARAALEATSVAQLAQAAAAVVCEMDVYCPGAPLDARRCADALAAAACARIAKCGAPEMHGRKAADAAFSFAIAGVLDMRVYAELADLLDAEIQRLATSMDASAPGLCEGGDARTAPARGGGAHGGACAREADRAARRLVQLEARRLGRARALRRAAAPLALATFGAPAQAQAG